MAQQKYFIKNFGLEINTQYLREDANFVLPPQSDIDSGKIQPVIEYGKCNYYTARGTEPSYIVQTYSVSPTLKAAVDHMVLYEGQVLKDARKAGVSIHYVIDRDGVPYQLVPDDKRAWDSGQGGLKYKTALNSYVPELEKGNMNSHDISVMMVNNAVEPFTPEQIKTNITLTHGLVNQYKIPLQNVTALGNWAVDRHVAPGPYFPWDEFAKHDLGLWPKGAKLVENPEVIFSLGNKQYKALPEDIAGVNSWLQEFQQKYSSFLGSDNAHNIEQAVQSINQNVAQLGFESTKSKLTNELGLITSTPNDPISLMASFNIHWTGNDILKYKLPAWESYAKNSANFEAKAVLGEWTENSDAMLLGLLEEAESFI